MIGLNLRPLPRIAARFCGLGRRRKYEFAADVLAFAAIAAYEPGVPVGSLILTEVGPVHLTLAAHESMRAYSLPRVGWDGVYFLRGRHTWTLTLIAFCFTLTLTWCWKQNIEKLDFTQVAGGV